MEILSDAHNMGTQTCTQAQSRTHPLLAALCSFLQPIIQTHASSSSLLPNDIDTVESARTEMGNMIEGQQLLDALEDFIKETVGFQLAEQGEVFTEKQNDEPADQPTPEAQSRTPTLPSTSISADTQLDLVFHDDSAEHWQLVSSDNTETQSQLPTLPTRTISTSTHSELMVHNPAEHLVIPSDTTETQSQMPTSLSTPISASTELELMVQKKLRRHLYNKMPIRLISFDSTGSGMQLIGREEIFRRILPKAYAEAAQAQFKFAWDHEENPWEMYKKKTRMIADLVERHARYAILSHTWIRDTPGDVVYQDWERRGDNPRGYRKIAKFCEVAAQNHGVTLGWIDSVCINKESSSELDESIRSMYKWYREAHVCVIYLSETRAHVLDDMRRDSWFTRGWTLQELLAPKHMRYYDTEWVVLIHRDVDINQQIQQATKITEEELSLCRQGNMDKIPISRIMQLAATREVTRKEDTSYSLMGLLRVDIPVAYGEGSERAFFRLVRELLNSRNHVLDIFNHGYRLFAKKLIPSTIMQYVDRSADFDMPGCETASLLDNWQPIESITLTHLGVRIQLLLIPAMEISKNNYIPYGDLSGVVHLHVQSAQFISEVHYYLLDRRIYTDMATWVADTLRKNSVEAGPLIATFGVLNFGVEDDNILLPQNCLSVPLDCGAIKPGNIVGPSNSIKIIAACKAPVFQLNSAVNSYTIPKCELARHGIQLVTLSLH